VNEIAWGELRGEAIRSQRMSHTSKKSQQICEVCKLRGPKKYEQICEAYYAREAELILGVHPTPRDPPDHPAYGRRANG
jgi:hypothetical protein